MVATTTEGKQACIVISISAALTAAELARLESIVGNGRAITHLYKVT